MTPSHCWGSRDQPSLERKAKDCKAAGSAEGLFSGVRVVGGSLSLCPRRRASQGLPKGKKHLSESSSCGLAGKVTLGGEMNSGGASQERDGRQHKESIRLLEEEALVRSELGKVGWAWGKNKKAVRSGKLKFGRFWFLESEGNKLVLNAFSLQECAECLNSLSCPHCPQLPEHTKHQRGRWEQSSTRELHAHSSFAPLQPVATTAPPV